MGEHRDGSIWHGKVAYFMMTRKQREKKMGRIGESLVPPLNVTPDDLISPTS